MKLMWLVLSLAIAAHDHLSWDEIANGVANLGSLISPNDCHQTCEKEKMKKKCKDSPLQDSEYYRNLSGQDRVLYRLAQSFGGLSVNQMDRIVEEEEEERQDQEEGKFPL